MEPERAMNTLDLIFRSLPLLCQGALMTLQVLLFSATLSLIIGTFLGSLCCSKLKIPFISRFIEALTFVLRAVPFFVQLLIAYFVLPDLLGFNLEPFPASVIALGLCSSGYTAQIVRSGLNSIPLSQWETAATLGYTPWQTLRYIIFPQAFKLILGPLNNELDALLKSTAIVSSIGMLELTRMGMNIVSREMEPVPIYLTVALFYLCMSVLLKLLTQTLEKRLSDVKG
jgi:His/Glu/Gln/Arg/opine family amino acid ABC transporter permease subunit